MKLMFLVSYPLIIDMHIGMLCLSIIKKGVHLYTMVVLETLISKFLHTSAQIEASQEASIWIVEIDDSWCLQVNLRKKHEEVSKDYLEAVPRWNANPLWYV